MNLKVIRMFVIYNITFHSIVITNPKAKRFTFQAKSFTYFFTRLTPKLSM